MSGPQRASDVLLPAARVTVLLPHYRCEPYLAEAVASILAQELRDLALVVVDDASPDDGWRDVLEPFRRDPRLVVLQSSHNVGPYRLKNQLLARVRSPFVAFQDADDRSAPRRLALQVAALERGRADIVGCSFTYVAADGTALRQKRMRRNVNLWLRLGKKFVALHGSLVATRVALLALGGFDGTTRYGADDELLWRAAQVCRIRNLPELLYDYRLRGQSLTGAPETGHGSPARRAYAEAMRARPRPTALAPRAMRLARLQARPNDVPFSLRAVHR
jgi:glycosyltransferase involved in cell wall biosynthesis